MPTRPTEVSLSLSECEPGALPPVCAKCGAPATGETAVDFVWFPPKTLWAMFCCRPAFAVMLVTLSARRTVSLPVCDRHVRVRNRGKTILLRTVAVCVPLLLAFWLIDGGGLTSALLLVAFFGLAVGVAAAAVVLLSGIQARLIHEQEIILTGLHPDFVDAVENHSPERQAAYDAARAARNPGEPRA